MASIKEPDTPPSSSIAGETPEQTEAPLPGPAPAVAKPSKPKGLVMSKLHQPEDITLLMEFAKKSAVANLRSAVDSPARSIKKKSIGFQLTFVKDGQQNTLLHVAAEFAEDPECMFFCFPFFSFTFCFSSA